MFYRVLYCDLQEMYSSSNIFEIENQSIKETYLSMMLRVVAPIIIQLPPTVHSMYYIAHTGTDTFECTSIAACSCLTAAKRVCTFHMTFASKHALQKGLELSCAWCINPAWNKKMVSTTAESSRRLQF